MTLTRALDTAQTLTGPVTIQRKSGGRQIEPEWTFRQGEGYIITLEELQAEDWVIKAPGVEIGGTGRTPGEILANLIRIHLDDVGDWESIAQQFAEALFQTGRPACQRCGQLCYPMTSAPHDRSILVLDIFEWRVVQWKESPDHQKPYTKWYDGWGYLSNEPDYWTELPAKLQGVKKFADRP